MVIMYIVLPSQADPKGTPLQYTISMPTPITDVGEVAVTECLIVQQVSSTHTSLACRLRLNICQPCIDGNLLQPVVRDYTFPPSKHGVFHEEFEEPYYIPVSTGYIPAITTTVELDSQVPLVATQIVLHFRTI